MTRRKEQAERSRSLLIDTALRLFVAQGYEATSVSQILEAAGMARGALYHHFPEGKRELFGEVVEVADHPFHTGLDEIVATVASPMGRVEAGWKLVLDLATDPVFAKIVLVEAQAVAPDAWTGGAQFQLLRATLAEAIAAGEIRPVPVDAAASTLFGAIRRMADYIATAEDPVQAARDGDLVLRALVDGLRA